MYRTNVSKELLLRYWQKTLFWLQGFMHMQVASRLSESLSAAAAVQPLSTARLYRGYCSVTVS